MVTDFNYICDELKNEGLLNCPDINNKGQGQYRRLRLTFKGWKKYQDLQRHIEDSKLVFMAMKFPSDNIQKAATRRSQYWICSLISLIFARVKDRPFML